MRSLLALCLSLMLLSVHADARHTSVLGAGGSPFGSGGSGDATTGLLPSYADANPNWAKAGLQTVGGISGVESGYTQCGSTVTPSGLIPSQSGDDASLIKAAINACTSGHYVLLSGKFQVTISEEPINDDLNGVVLRGSGACNNAVSPHCPTSISVYDGALPYTAGGNGTGGCGVIGGSVVNCPNGGSPLIYMGPVEPSAGSVSWGTCGPGGNVGTGCGAIALTSDAAQGDTTIQVASTTGFAVGQYVLIDEDSGAQWIADPMSSVDGWANIYGAPEMLNGSGSPAVARVSWSKFENAGGTSFGGDLGSSDPKTANTSGCWFSFCGRPTAEIHKITAVGTGTITFDDPLTIGFRVSHTAQVYPPETANCNGCSYVISDNMIQNAGLENISLLRAPTGGVLMRFCRYCFVDNTEVSEWYGGGISVQYSLRSELNTDFVQRCWWCTNNGGEYPIDVSDASTEILLTNSITEYAGKGMVMRAGGAGSVISYNDFDRTLYTESPSDVWIEMSANASHYIGAHHVLFEGNSAVNLDNDDTHGSTDYITYYRNKATGFRSKLTDPSNGTIVDDINALPGGNGPFRAAGPMAYNYWISYVGNVLGVSGKTTSGNGWTYDTACGWANAQIYMLGWNTGPGGCDPYINGTSGSYVFRHGNYDYFNSSVTWNSGNANHTLTNSFYLSGAPSFFTATGCTYSWPWVTPTGGSQFTTNSCGGPGLPAQARADAGTPFVNPTTNGNSIFGAYLSSASFTTGTAGTVGVLSPELSSGTFSGTYGIVTTGTDAWGVTCNNYGSDFSISGSNLNYSAAAPVQSYPGVCVSITQTGALNSPLVEAFNLTGAGATNYFTVIAHGAVANSASGGNGVTVSGINATGANLIIAAIGSTAAVHGTLTDSSGNTWNWINGPSYGGPPWYNSLVYCAPCTVSSSMSFTYSQSSSFPAMAILALSDSHGTPTLDQSNTAPKNTSGVTSIQPGSVTPTIANELLVTGLAQNTTAATNTVNDGFTISDQVLAVPSDSVGVALAYILDGTTSPINPTWSLVSSDTPGSAIATFKP